MNRSQRRRVLLPLSIAGLTAVALAGCVGDNQPAATDSGDSGTSAGCADYEAYGTFEGDEVSIYGSILDVEADRLNESWADFEECTGIDVVYEGSSEFESQLNVRVQGGNAPNLAIVPQPGLVATLAGQGHLTPAPDGVAANVDQFWSEDWAAYGTVDGTLYGAPLMASVKGFVWYSPSAFSDAGYEVPTTLDELDELTAQIQGDGSTPWCVGFGSGTATGWPGTDWVEDYVLRLAGPEVYDQWVAHEIPFDDPAIVEAMDRVGDIIRNPDYVNAGFGDVSTIAGTDFGDAGLPILDGECSLHHQASFYEGFWPEGTTVAEDGDVWAFLLPGDEADASAVTGGGEIVVAFTDDPAVQAVQTYLSSDTWANIRVGLGGVISANSGLDPANASSPLLQQAVEILQNPDTTFRFDGSDLMPGAVGAGSFWTAMVDWIGGKSTEESLAFVESSWP